MILIQRPYNNKPFRPKMIRENLYGLCSLLQRVDFCKDLQARYSEYINASLLSFSLNDSAYRIYPTDVEDEFFIYSQKEKESWILSLVDLIDFINKRIKAERRKEAQFDRRFIKKLNRYL